MQPEKGFIQGQAFWSLGEGMALKMTLSESCHSLLRLSEGPRD